MFDNLIGSEEQPNPTEALLKLLDKENRDSKTILEMPNIKFLLKSRWLLLKKLYPEKSIIERQEMLTDYFKDLMPSYMGFSWKQVTEGIKEMKPQIMEFETRKALSKK